MPNRDIAGFADAIVRLSDDPALALRLGAAARELILDTSSWDKAAERCERVYADVIGAQSASMTAQEAEGGLCRLPPASMRREEQVTPVP